MSRFSPFDSISGNATLYKRVERLCDLVDELEEFMPILPGLIRKLKSDQPPVANIFLAVITGSDPLTPIDPEDPVYPNRWRYSWVQHTFGGGTGGASSSGGTADPFTFPAYNGFEFANTTTTDSAGDYQSTGNFVGPFGTGVSSLLPVGNGKNQLVLMMEIPVPLTPEGGSGPVRHWFFAANAVDVVCQTNFGACCLPDGSCQDVEDEAACTALGGTYLGDGTACAEGGCDPPPVP